MRLLASGQLPGFDRVPIWFNDPSNWWGPDGLLIRLREHVIYTVLIVLIAMLIALPIGVLIGHTGRGVSYGAGVTNALRAIPTLGFVLLLYVWLSPKIHSNGAVPLLYQRGAAGSFVAVLIVLVLLAIPPILTNTYAGIQAVDPDARDAARGMGMTGWQVSRQVELPCALPLIISGIRSATLQVIATVTVAAYVPLLGGLGRYIVDGANDLTSLQYGYPAMVCGGIVIALLAVVADGLLTLLQRLAVSPGISGRFGTRATTATPEVSTEIPVGAELTKA